MGKVKFAHRTRISTEKWSQLTGKPTQSPFGVALHFAQIQWVQFNSGFGVLAKVPLRRSTFSAAVSAIPFYIFISFFFPIFGKLNFLIRHDLYCILMSRLPSLNYVCCFYFCWKREQRKCSLAFSSSSAFFRHHIKLLLFQVVVAPRQRCLNWIIFSAYCCCCLSFVKFCYRSTCSSCWHALCSLRLCVLL